MEHGTPISVLPGILLGATRLTIEDAVRDRLRALAKRHGPHDGWAGRRSSSLPVFPDTGGVDHPMLVRCKVAGAAAVVVPDNVYRMPAAGLGESPVDSIDAVPVQRIRSQIRGIFN